MDAFLDKKPIRNCKLIETDSFGMQIVNSTDNFTGAIGLLQNKKGDFFFYPGSQYFKKEFFEHSHPNDAERFVIEN